MRLLDVEEVIASEPAPAIREQAEQDGAEDEDWRERECRLDGQRHEVIRRREGDNNHKIQDRSPHVLRGLFRRSTRRHLYSRGTGVSWVRATCVPSGFHTTYESIQQDAETPGKNPMSRVAISMRIEALGEAEFRPTERTRAQGRG